MANVLTVYYSRKGENYFGGAIRSVAKGSQILPMAGGATTSYYYGHLKPQA